MSSLTLPPLWTRRKAWVAVFAFAIVFSLLFQYRILSLLKRLGVDVTPVGTKFPIAMDFQSAPQWLLPIYYTADYLNTVWFTTTLGLLLAGAVITFLPGFIQSRLRGDGLKEHVAGVVLGLPNMLCTCCAATTLPGLRTAGAGLGASLAFFVTAPTLNIVVIFLAFQTLPLKLAIARTLLGLMAAAGVTYVLAKLYPGIRPSSIGSTCSFQHDKTVAGILRSWLANTWDAAKATIPLLILGILIISVFKTFMPFETIATNLADGLLPTVLASVLGTIIMIPTFTEVLWVGEFTKQGMGVGPAVALLITLPAVSFPSLWVLGRVYGSYRLALSLGASILCLGVISGLIFQMI